MRYGGRRRNVSFARAQAAHILTEDFRISLAEVARILGVTTSAIFNMLERKNDKFNQSRTSPFCPPRKIIINMVSFWKRLARFKL